MSDPILPLLQWPAGIQQASVPANDNALRVEALSRPALGTANDESTPADGDVWIVGSAPTGAFSSFDEDDIALYHVDEVTNVGGWHAWAPVEDVRLVVNDTRMVWTGSNGWITDPSVGGAVDSVNGQTGVVVLDAADVGALESIVAGTGVTIDDTDPQNPVINATGGGSGIVESIVAGTGVTVDDTDPANPIVSATGGGGSLTGFTASLETASPNNTVNASVLLASGGTTNQDAVVQPKGTGGFSLQRADGTATGGNKRGSRAVDLQCNRNSADQVASGESSLVAGANNRASSAYAMTLGSNNVASSQNAVAVGSSNTASGFASVAVGSNCTASGTSSVAIGSLCLANAELSSAQGYLSTTLGVYGMRAFASGIFSSNAGEAQRMDILLRRSTSNASPTELTSNNSAPAATNQVVLSNNSAYKVRATVIAREASTGDVATWDIEFTIKRGANAAATAIVGTPTVTPTGADAGAAAWTVAVSADTTNGAARFTVTGEASKSIRWVADVYSIVRVA